jgi:coenzyme F420-reducing hydrogenase alpha subunit
MTEVTLEHITRIEGHARLTLRIDKGRVDEVSMDVFEGARYFEGILKNRRFDEAPHLASRICGVCSQAHLLTAIKAVEEALGVVSTPQTEILRELLLLGQFIQSHSLHLYFLAFPDYFSVESAMQLAKDHPELLKRGLKLKRLGNDLVQAVGAREVHSITPVIGGFSKMPDEKALSEVLDRLLKAMEDAAETAVFMSVMEFPEFERRTEYISLKKEGTYALLHGNLASTDGLFVPHEEYAKYLQERSKESSTSKFVLSEGEGYMVGALARINLNRKMLSKRARTLVRELGMSFPSYNPFMNNFAQGVELLHCIERSIEILSELEIEEEDPVEFDVRGGRGVSATEVPRGTLFHEYELDDEGNILYANIITPTTQNLKNMEDDLKGFLPGILDKPKAEVIQATEKLVRSYDPCISCSTHFLWSEK